VQRSCDVCGMAYEAKRAASRYCSTRCRTAATRSRKAGKPVRRVVAIPGRPDEPGELERATVAEVAGAKREGSALGKAAVLLARRIDRSPAESGSSTAALYREWQSVLGRATAGAGAEKSQLDRDRDELAARRARRAGA
jgi:hypothetical protein